MSRNGQKPKKFSTCKENVMPRTRDSKSSRKWNIGKKENNHTVFCKKKQQMHKIKQCPDPRPHQSDKLDPDPEPRRFADDKPKMCGIWDYLSTFSRFWTFLEGRIRIRIRIRIKGNGRIQIWMLHFLYRFIITAQVTVFCFWTGYGVQPPLTNKSALHKCDVDASVGVSVFFPPGGKKTPQQRHSKAFSSREKEETL